MGITNSMLHYYVTELEKARGMWEPENHNIKYFIKEDDVLVLCDVHIPYHDVKMTALSLLIADLYKPGATAITGDLLDMPKFSHYGVTDHTMSYQKEKEIASDFLLRLHDIMSQHQGHIVISKGNHDARWIKKLDNHEDMKGLLCSISPEVANLIGEGYIAVTDHPSILAIPDDSGKPTWMLTHPAQYKQPFATPNMLAMMEGLNVLSAHAHHLGATRSSCSRYWCVEGGGLFDAEYFEYVQKLPNTMRRMASGFFLLRKGRAPMMFSESDYEYYDKNYDKLKKLSEQGLL